MPTRCDWCEGTFDQYVRYHDEEWGVPVHDDKTQFEFLMLESAQAGLSWSTILKKRAGYREAFANFDVQKVARFDEEKVQELLQNPEIIRNENKIRSAINNAQRFIAIQEEFGSFCNYIWDFVGGDPIQNEWKSLEEVPTNTPISNKLSKDLKQRGFKFIGSTIIYAHMQATGMVNDHITSCFRHQEVLNLT
ncbi:DNA-3-methyladenine glycosylase I [Fodinibius halophilus]|uniref:DNA-3-methyladenine glycosylase I n=1 Tax=Fodinibius halophilus TaxID=1736908 RepID=A0A6M1TBP4_9BACT|nr:DNA-3-methyladenine glycosylase I [Fodinibius halophilus]NGP89763.1 DNA-3-methyladenine glycosylase I [Fodinibius halophilus]